MMRLQKFLALSGVASRRNSEKLIADGHVAVNGKVITEMGVQVDESADVARFAKFRKKSTIWRTTSRWAR